MDGLVYVLCAILFVVAADVLDGRCLAEVKAVLHAELYGLYGHVFVVTAADLLRECVFWRLAQDGDSVSWLFFHTEGFAYLATEIAKRCKK